MTALRGELREHEPMSRHTSWRVGGPADIWYKPADRDDLREFLGRQQGEHFWLGLGSNLLVRDGGIRGAVLTVYDAFNRLRRLDERHVYAEAGVHCARLAKFCAAEGLSGAAFFAGIPGTLGGALAMNAGAFGDETWPHVKSVELLDADGQERQCKAEDFTWGYRHVESPFANAFYLSAELEFAPGAAEEETVRVRELLQKRRASQPVGQPSCGSVFRNPPGDHAARLIESCGLKGYRIGGAQVAEKHANFILNTGDASAADIEALIAHVQQTVAVECGVELRTEVRVVGEAA